ncbi:MAG: hypothetical protein JXB38_03190 [Anaerolineales bacterium]|nr:hypothetical protein [Anaerolineales bacterium]
MNREIIGTMLIVSGLLIPAIFNIPRLYTNPSNKALTDLQKRIRRYLGAPGLLAALFSLLFGVLDTPFMFRLSLSLMALLMGAEAFVTGAFVWPANENKRPFGWLLALPGAIFFVLGCTGVVVAYLWQ